MNDSVDVYMNESLSEWLKEKNELNDCKNGDNAHLVNNAAF